MTTGKRTPVENVLLLLVTLVTVAAIFTQLQKQTKCYIGDPNCDPKAYEWYRPLNKGVRSP
ncbi:MULTISPECIES: hypothetical protein [Nostocales]|uniref:Uncharacterized protein n=3 Tax=Nostocales TaxID=1161 RepID=A0A8S9TEG0_9CYAN|nr:hypothetical protein [Tolypothrix bouteillei]KAF3889984.1 hypothetical protein DA73_0400034375 [Tolypothrix bouteillei VB521301]